MTPSTTAQPSSVGKPTSRGSGVARHTAARAASFNTGHTLTYSAALAYSKSRRADQEKAVRARYGAVADFIAVAEFRYE